MRGAYYAFGAIVKNMCREAEHNGWLVRENELRMQISEAQAALSRGWDGLHTWRH